MTSDIVDAKTLTAIHHPDTRPIHRADTVCVSTVTHHSRVVNRP